MEMKTEADDADEVIDCLCPRYNQLRHG